MVRYYKFKPDIREYSEKLYRPKLTEGKIYKILQCFEEQC